MQLLRQPSKLEAITEKEQLSPKNKATFPKLLISTQVGPFKLNLKILNFTVKRSKLYSQSSQASLSSQSPLPSHLSLENPHPADAWPADWVITKHSKKSMLVRPDAILAVDCEMVLCVRGTEALVRVCVVDRNLKVKLDKIVNPNKEVTDYRTEITGMIATDFDGVTCSLVDVQKSMKKLLSKGYILVSHSLSNDLQALKIDHALVIDTSFIFKYSDDATAAMKLVLARIERQVPETKMTKLLLHRIPKHVTSEELKKVMPGEFEIELKHEREGAGKKKMTWGRRFSLVFSSLHLSLACAFPL
ncbi:hypothetical protein UlMin_000119 [Ulmus minor]